jgi:DNA ligase (NAD+)
VFSQKFDIRGEIILPGFENESGSHWDGETPYSNPAIPLLVVWNCRIVPRFLNDRWIAVLLWIACLLQSQFEALQSAREWGFKVPQEVTQASNLEQVFSLLIIGMFMTWVTVWNWWCCCQVNNFQFQDELLYSKSPSMMAMAYKFKSEKSQPSWILSPIKLGAQEHYSCCKFRGSTTSRYHCQKSFCIMPIKLKN